MVRSELLQKMRDLHPNILSKDMEKIFEIIFIEFTNAFCRNENVDLRRVASLVVVVVEEVCDIHINIPRKDMEKILDIIFSEMGKALFRGENVEIRGFGTYKIAKRKARTGRNPKNAQLVQIPEKKAIKWKMSKTFFDRLNNNFTGNKISDTY